MIRSDALDNAFPAELCECRRFRARVERGSRRHLANCICPLPRDAPGINRAAGVKTLLSASGLRRIVVQYAGETSSAKCTDLTGRLPPEGLVAFGEADPGLLAARPDMPGRSAAKIAASLRRTVLIFFECFSNGHISGALAELIRSTRAPTKDRLKGKIMSGGPVFRGNGPEAGS